MLLLFCREQARARGCCSGAATAFPRREFVPIVPRQRVDEMQAAKEQGPLTEGVHDAF